MRSPLERELSQVLAELIAREPIFHRPEHGTSRADFDSMMDPAFCEVGASGARYSRDLVLDELEKRHRSPSPAEKDDLHATDFQCVRLAPDVFLLTYTLAQGLRITRRSTIWRHTGEGWKIVYHQGTIVQQP